MFGDARSSAKELMGNKSGALRKYWGGDLFAFLLSWCSYFFVISGLES